MGIRRNNRGILSGFKARLQKNRLGELLVLDGFLHPDELKQALKLSKDSNQPLGQFLVEQDLVDVAVIRQTLVEQFTLRFVTAALTVFLSLASFGISKQARAASIKDVPSLMQVANESFAPVSHYPKLFGATEKRSTNLKAFTKWSGMFSRFERSFQKTADQGVINEFKHNLESMRGLSLNKMVVQVNDLVNKQRYIVDSKNYGQTDYWATPVEFLRKGGDCEDFAIAKYTALRALGVPEERLRVVILQDMQKNIPHAVLVVYTDNGPMLLDNQIKRAVKVSSVDHYKPIFSINRHAWWLHSKPKATVTVVASSAGR
ncbi:MAG: transglutaminase-like cysteine peptidase [Pseudomonadota bacterium]